MGTYIDGAPGRQFLEAKGSHVLVSDKVGDASAWNRYQWTIYDQQGTRLGAVDSFTSFARFAVVGNTLLFETPAYARRVGDNIQESGPMLRAVGLSNGVEQWSVPLMETKYVGLLPP